MEWKKLDKKSLKWLRQFDSQQWLFASKEDDYFQVIEWMRSMHRWIASGRSYDNEDMLEEFGYYCMIEQPKVIKDEIELIKPPEMPEYKKKIYKEACDEIELMSGINDELKGPEKN